MRPIAWSVVLQWTRVGGGAVVLLGAARFLDLSEIGAFAAAHAPLRWLLGTHRAAIGDVAIVAKSGQHDQVFWLSAGLGLLMAASLLAGAAAAPAPVGVLLAALAALPLAQGIAAPSEARLRAALRLRALALRSLGAQGLAVTAALLVLAQGGGAWSLVTFVLVNTCAASALAVVMAPAWPRLRPDAAGIFVLSAPTIRLALRDLTGGATLPLLHVMVAASLGLTAAGALQIATRILSLVDALAVAPIRYVALPRFAAGTPTDETLAQTARIACLVYPGMLLVAGPALTVAVGADHAAAVTPLMPAMALLGLASALSMPLVQALTAADAIGLTLKRSGILLFLSLALALPGLAVSVVWTTAALPLASGLVLAGFLPAAGRALRLPLSRLVAHFAGPLAAGLCLMAAAFAARAALGPVSPALEVSVPAATGAAAYIGVLILGDRLRRTVAA